MLGIPKELSNYIATCGLLQLLAYICTVFIHPAIFYVLYQRLCQDACIAATHLREIRQVSLDCHSRIAVSTFGSFLQRHNHVSPARPFPSPSIAGRYSWRKVQRNGMLSPSSESLCHSNFLSTCFLSFQQIGFQMVIRLLK